MVVDSETALVRYCWHNSQDLMLMVFVRRAAVPEATDAGTERNPTFGAGDGVSTSDSNWSLDYPDFIDHPLAKHSKAVETFALIHVSRCLLGVLSTCCCQISYPSIDLLNTKVLTAATQRTSL